MPLRDVKLTRCFRDKFNYVSLYITKILLMGLHSIKQRLFQQFKIVLYQVPKQSKRLSFGKNYKIAIHDLGFKNMLYPFAGGKRHGLKDFYGARSTKVQRSVKNMFQVVPAQIFPEKIVISLLCKSMLSSLLKSTSL